MSRVYEIITNSIIDALERGTVPWQRPWKSWSDRPRNLASGKQYRGINAIVLSSAGFSSPWWVTYRQALQRGGHVRKGEHGYPCIYYTRYEPKDGSAEARVRSVVRYYTVFNVEQCDGLAIPPRASSGEHVFSPLDQCELVVAGMPHPPRIKHGGNRALYYWGKDVIRMPQREQFETAEHYYSTLFHELVHSTGHEARLDRHSGRFDELSFGSLAYAREELVAEIGAAFLCGHAGIENQLVDSSAAYIEAWLTRLRSDRGLLLRAAGEAQKAADYVVGIRGDESADGK